MTNPRLVKTQCSCSSGFSRELWPWIGSSVKYDCSLVTRGSVRFHIQSSLQITTWTRSSALIGPEGTLLVFLFQAPFTTIDMHLSGIRPAPTGTDEMHTTQGHNSNCGNALQALCGACLVPRDWTEFHRAIRRARRRLHPARVRRRPRASARGAVGAWRPPRSGAAPRRAAASTSTRPILPVIAAASLGFTMVPSRIGRGPGVAAWTARAARGHSGPPPSPPLAVIVRAERGACCVVFARPPRDLALHHACGRAVSPPRPLRLRRPPRGCA